MPSRIEIIECVDPYWHLLSGSEPTLGKIKDAYGDQVEVYYRADGLVRDIQNFYNLLNEIGGERWYRQVADHLDDASRRHDTKVTAQSSTRLRRYSQC